MIKLKALILICISLFMLTGCTEETLTDYENDSSFKSETTVSNEEQIEIALSKDETIMPKSSTYFEGKSYKDVYSILKEAGFSNITLQEIKKEKLDIFEDEEDVEEITVIGNNTFSEGDIFKKSADIIIKYVVSNKEVITINNNSTFKSLLETDTSYFTDDEWRKYLNSWEVFFDNNEGQIIEFNGIMLYNHEGDWGSSNYIFHIYPDLTGTRSLAPIFIFKEVTVTKKGLENFDFSEDHDLFDGEKVIIKGEIEYFNDPECMIELISIEKRN